MPVAELPLAKTHRVCARHAGCPALRVRFRRDDLEVGVELRVVAGALQLLRFVPAAEVPHQDDAAGEISGAVARLHLVDDRLLAVRRIEVVSGNLQQCPEAVGVLAHYVIEIVFLDIDRIRSGIYFRQIDLAWRKRTKSGGELVLGNSGQRRRQENECNHILSWIGARGVCRHVDACDARCDRRRGHAGQNGTPA